MSEGVDFWSSEEVDEGVDPALTELPFRKPIPMRRVLWAVAEPLSPSASPLETLPELRMPINKVLALVAMLKACDYSLVDTSVAQQGRGIWGLDLSSFASPKVAFSEMKDREEMPGVILRPFSPGVCAVSFGLFIPDGTGPATLFSNKRGTFPVDTSSNRTSPKSSLRRSRSSFYPSPALFFREK